ncbi:MAG: hypothetical protein H6Q97_427, partial [Nitrospirae bacterium]|nr:hypothetical protein [Nitrospirota bacterium]
MSEETKQQSTKKSFFKEWVEPF